MACAAELDLGQALGGASITCYCAVLAFPNTSRCFSEGFLSWPFQCGKPLVGAHEVTISSVVQAVIDQDLNPLRSDPEFDLLVFASRE